MSRVVEETHLHPDYPLPDLDDPIMRPFWDGARELRLMQQRDRTTGAVHWPPKPLYWKGGGRLEWFQASGKGTVYTYVVAHEPFLAAFKHLMPHVMVVVQLAEGARIVGHMIGTSPAEMSIGMPVRVAFKRLTPAVTLPVWELDRDPPT